MSSRTDTLADWVGGRVQSLQRGYLADEAGAVRQLAVLRRSKSGGIGDPEVWATLEGMPEALTWDRDEPRPYERAAYDAVVLFAVHQQSHRARGMHRAGARLGQALGTLKRSGGSEDAVERRFKQLGAAATYDASLWHLRGLVTQLRGADIAVDYGLLARDLLHLQRQDTRDRARLRWGRDFYRPAPKADIDHELTTEGDLS